MKVKEIADYLASQMPELSQGVNLFIHSMPAEIEEGVLLRISGAGTNYNYDLPKFFRGQMIVVVRGTNYQVCDERANKINAILTKVQFQMTPTLFFNYLRPTQQPFPFQNSVGGYREFASNFTSCYVAD